MDSNTLRVSHLVLFSVNILIVVLTNGAGFLKIKLMANHCQVLAHFIHLNVCYVTLHVLHFSVVWCGVIERHVLHRVALELVV